MRLLLIGPPGSGKGTQAKRIGMRFGIRHISSGELLRREVERDTEIGRAVRDQLDRGELVPDAVVLDVLREPMQRASREGGYVLDGFPRTLAQAEAAYLAARDADAHVQVALYLRVPTPLLIERMLARGTAGGRTDDTLEVITHRLRVFDEVTPPLLDYYARREVLIGVDGVGSRDEVAAAAIAELERLPAELR